MIPFGSWCTLPLRLGDAAQERGQVGDIPKSGIETAEMIAMSQKKSCLIMFLIPFAGTCTSGFPLPQQQGCNALPFQ